MNNESFTYPSTETSGGDVGADQPIIEGVPEDLQFAGASQEEEVSMEPVISGVPAEIRQGLGAASLRPERSRLVVPDRVSDTQGLAALRDGAARSGLIVRGR